MRKKFLFLLFIFVFTQGNAQPVDYSNCPSCTTADIELVKEVNTKYLGVLGSNPSVPSTYKLVGNRKFCCGDFWDAISLPFGNNWYPIRVNKQIFRGKFDHFAVNTYGEESDWDIYLSPAPGFDDFINESLPYKFGAGVFPHNWPKDKNGEYCVEAEITPPSEKYGNIWFNNSRNGSSEDAFNANNYLIGKTICTYGPFVMEESHGNHPEIHPSEQIWWKENDNLTNILLVGDGSGRFDYIGDYNTDGAIAGYKAWTPDRELEAVLKIPFNLKPSEAALSFNISVIDDFNFYNGANYTDVSAGTSHKIVYNGKKVLTVDEPAQYDQKLGITFSDVCFNRATNTLQGFIVIKTATGNGYKKEGFVLLQIDKRETKFHKTPVLKNGNLLNSWSVFNNQYDNSIYFESIISSDKDGKGIVDGMVDFNGNGITDFFAVNGGNWMVLYDGKGAWQKINRSHIPINNLRFGDINGDKITDVLYADLDGAILVSYKGIGSLVKINQVDENYRDIRVGDFDGDDKTDLVYLRILGRQNKYDNSDTADMFVQYECKGDPKMLNSNYHLKPGGFDNNLFFGHFNKDNKTDVFRYDNNRFLVYWGGKGDYVVLNDELPNGIKPGNLLFANNLSAPGITDVIHVDPVNKKWVTFYGGKPGTLPMQMDVANPDKIFFGNVTGTAGWEPFMLDYITRVDFADPEKFIDVVKAETEPFVIPEYEKGSIKRLVNNGVASFVIDMGLDYVEGSPGAVNKKSGFTAISKVSEKQTSRLLQFQSTNDAAKPDKLGTLKSISFSGADNNAVSFDFAAGKMSYAVPAYGIGAFNGKLTQAAAGTGNWEKWKPYLVKGEKAGAADMFNKAPGKIEKISSVEFEIIPFYSAKIAGGVSMVEMGEPQEELNAVAYGTDEAKKKELFGDSNVFTVKWQFELKNLTTGQAVVFDNAKPLATQGKWGDSKFSFSFPVTDDLLQLVATAIITDAMGVKSKPLEFNYYNQQVKLKDIEGQVQQWVTSLRNIAPAKQKYYKTRTGWLAEDGVLTPGEMKIINQ